jgi:hypothetical protein
MLMFWRVYSDVNREFCFGIQVKYPKCLYSTSLKIHSQGLYIRTEFKENGGHMLFLAHHSGNVFVYHHVPAAFRPTRYHLQQCITTCLV